MERSCRDTRDCVTNPRGMDLSTFQEIIAAATPLNRLIVKTLSFPADASAPPNQLTKRVGAKSVGENIL